MIISAPLMRKIKEYLKKPSSSVLLKVAKYYKDLYYSNDFNKDNQTVVNEELGKIPSVKNLYSKKMESSIIDVIKKAEDGREDCEAVVLLLINFYALVDYISLPVSNYDNLEKSINYAKVRSLASSLIELIEHCESANLGTVSELVMKRMNLIFSRFNHT